MTVYVASHPFAFVMVEALRRAGPALHVPRVGTVVNDSCIARSVLDDGEHFSKAAPGSAGAVLTQVMGEYALLNLDGEAHRDLRRRIGDLFGGRYLDMVTAEVLRDPVHDLVDELRVGRSVDLVPFVQRLTGRMICHQIGIVPTPGDQPAVFDGMFWRGASLVSVMRLSTTRLTEPQVARARALWADFTDQVATAYNSAGPPSSVVHTLRNRGLTMPEVTGVAGALFLTGTQSVSTALPRLVALLADTGQWSTLRERPELLPQAIDEGLRVIVPSPVMVRSTTAATRIHGHRFAVGDRVVVLTYNLAKDPRLYPRPRHFDITRNHPLEGRHLWFGVGGRFCLGFALAHRELSTVLTALLELPGDLEVVRRRPSRGVLIPSYSRLEVRLHRAGAA
jgi:cytochrome P450